MPLLLAGAAAVWSSACRGEEGSKTGSHVASEVKDDDVEEEAEEPATLADLPPATRAAILGVAGSNAIEEVEKLLHRGSAVYEAEFRKGGVEHSVLVDAAGEILEIRDVVPTARLPAAVRAAVERELPGGVIEEAEAVHAADVDEPARFEIEVKLGGRTRRLTVPSSRP